MVIAVSVVAVGAGPALAQSQPGPPSAEELKQQLIAATGGRGRLADHAGTGRLRFFGTEPTRPVPRPGNVRSDAEPEAAARGFLSTYGTLFGADDQARQLRTSRARGADQGRSSVRFQQVHDGVPVFGGELVVNLDRNANVLSTNGELSPDVSVGTEPVIAADEARRQAATAIAKGRGLAVDAMRASDAELFVYDPVLIGAPDRRPPALVWRTEVTSAGGEPMRELVLVDAGTGAVVLYFDQIAHARDRRICDRSNVVNPDEVCVAPYTRVEGGPPTGVVDVDSTYAHSGNVFDYFSANFGRDGLDGAGMPLISTVRFCPSFFDCPFDGAVWTGSQAVFGQGYFVDDVVAHEFTHAVTEFESNLFYYFQAGAINESLSDVFGELIDLENGLGDDSPGVRWLLGEEAPGGAIRSLANPPAFGHPDSMESSNYWTNYGDNGGVHMNSGVNNKAAVLMTDGGTFNGVTVAGLGLTKVGHIYHEANANLLVSGSDFQDLFRILPQACLNKVGTAGITIANCTEVERAVSATKMNQPVPDGGALEAPVCDTAGNQTDLFVDDMENPASGNWTFGGTGGDGWAHDIGYATSGIRSLFTPDVPEVSDRTAARSGAVVPPVGAATFLRFNHAYDLEGNFDGAVVEYSTDGGGVWTDAGPLFVNNGYNRTNAEGPLAGRQVFSDFSAGYGSSRLSLSTLAGQSVRFRFRVATDSSVGFLGWLIDDVRVYTCASAVAGTGTTSVGSTSPEPGDAVSVGATGVTSASTSYRLRMGNTAANCNTSPLLLGGAVNSTGGFNIATVQRIIPTNSTSGVRWLCWVATGNTSNHSVPAQVTIV